MSSNTIESQKESRLSIRASESEKALLRQAAQARHMNTSEFVRQASLDAARAILEEQSTFRLSEADWQAFCARLDAPAKTIPALQKLFREKEPYGD